jgi:hypothetical protein
VTVAPTMRSTLSFLAASATTHAPAYAERRTHEGLSKPEIIRCLKRYVAREIFNALPMLVPRTVPRTHLPNHRSIDPQRGHPWLTNTAAVETLRIPPDSPRGGAVALPGAQGQG